MPAIAAHRPSSRNTQAAAIRAAFSGSFAANLLPSATTGTFDDRIVISSTSTRQPTVTIPVLGTIESQQQYARHRGGDTASR